MTKNPLTYKQICNIKKPGRYFDGNNLHLLVKQAKVGFKKYFIFRYTMNGKRNDKSLGRFLEFTLSEARKTAHTLSRSIDRGINPFQDRYDNTNDEKTIMPNVKPFALDWIKTKSIEWKNKKHRSQWGATLESYAFPHIGRKQLDAITTNDILQILRPMWKSRTETATRIRGRIEGVL